jgi:hypothetical protein
MRLRHLPRLTAVVLVTAVLAAPAVGYIHFPPTTMKILCEMSRGIRVLTVKKHDKEKGIIVFEVTETLKGKTPAGTTFKHVIGKQTKETKPIFDWVADGKQAVMFNLESTTEFRNVKEEIACGYVFIDKFCYSVDRNAKEGYWLLFRVDPQMGATLYGTAETVAEVTRDFLAGKPVKVPVDESVKHLTIKEREKLVPAVNAIMTKNREK